MKTDPHFQTIHATADNVNTPGPDSMRHHNDTTTTPRIVISLKGSKPERTNLYMATHYGVSSYQRVLTKGLFIKRYDRIRDCLGSVADLPAAERQVVLSLLKFVAYYGLAYPKAAQLAEE